ncbi:hypothetical protein FACS189485_14290 [Spirochaetia bacterium]|nr:hypothetical protein FACS189485_14290 [Spirochaetia bacterium]
MIRIITRAEASSLRENLLRIAAVIAALVASALIMILIGYNPLDIYEKILTGSLGTLYRFKNTINKAIPLAALSLGTAIAFKMKFWNIGQEGQFYLGAFGASLIAFAFPNMPTPLLLIFMFITAFLFAGLWALIPALLKARFSTSETLVTLMLNYVAAKWIGFLQYGPWRDPAGSGEWVRRGDYSVLIYRHWRLFKILSGR